MDALHNIRTCGEQETPSWPVHWSGGGCWPAAAQRVEHSSAHEVNDQDMGFLLPNENLSKITSEHDTVQQAELPLAYTPIGPYEWRVGDDLPRGYGQLLTKGRRQASGASAATGAPE